MLGKLDVISVFISWLLLGGFFLRLAYEQFLANTQTESLAWTIFIVFLISAALHITLAFFNRCPNCNKMLTAQGFKKPHSNSAGDWTKVVWHWFSGSIVCIHCGERVNTNRL